MALPRRRRPAAARAACRGGDAAARSAVAVARLSAGARQARRGAARIRRARREQDALSRAGRASQPRVRPPKSGSDASRRPKGSTTRPSRTSTRAVTLFPELGAAHYALALSYRALGRVDEARSALALHEQYGARWPALVDPVLATVTTLREDAGAILQRGVKLADAGDIDGAIAAHEAALARDPQLAQAHANLISLYGRARNWSKAEEHYRAFVRSGGGRRRRALRLRRAAGPAGEVGSRDRRLPRGARPQSDARAARRTTSDRRSSSNASSPKPPMPIARRWRISRDSGSPASTLRAC